ncbi:hypothetical protein LJD40_26715, partial [Escherichia coli]|nr:hypothetical protein [Escherichia coli]
HGELRAWVAQNQQLAFRNSEAHTAPAADADPAAAAALAEHAAAFEATVNGYRLKDYRRATSDASSHRV